MAVGRRRNPGVKPYSLRASFPSSGCECKNTSLEYLPIKTFCEQNFITRKQLKTLARKKQVFVLKLRNFRNKLFVCWNPNFKL